MSETTKFKHDCDRCEFVGQDDKYDYYTCYDNGSRYFVVRYGNDRTESYFKTLIRLKSYGENIWEAFKFFKDKGFLK